jgi:hypothetical protein
MGDMERNGQIGDKSTRRTIQLHPRTSGKTSMEGLQMARGLYITFDRQTSTKPSSSRNPNTPATMGHETPTWNVWSKPLHEQWAPPRHDKMPSVWPHQRNSQTRKQMSTTSGTTSLGQANGNTRIMASKIHTHPTLITILVTRLTEWRHRRRRSN